MPAVLYNFVLALVFITGITMMIQPHRQTRAFMQTLDDIQNAGIDYIGAHCNDPLPDAVTGAGLQASGHLDDGFDDQGVGFTWRLADHPVVSVNAGGDAAYLVFLAGRTLGGFETDGSYTFIPGRDITFFRAANNWYNLFAYDECNFACDLSCVRP